MSPVIEVVRTYLELRSPEQLIASTSNDPAVRFVRHDAISVDDYRRLYRDVGARWQWKDRVVWSDERLAAHLARPDIIVWETLVDDRSAGFFELERHPEDNTVEVAYFGLIDGFIGRGVGKAMLVCAASEAWAFAPDRVWLHTCTLDSPQALPNYKARGFTPFRTETYVTQVL